MTEPSITRDMELAEILSRFPACRKVLPMVTELVGCGGPLGPQESLAGSPAHTGWMRTPAGGIERNRPDERAYSRSPELGKRPARVMSSIRRFLLAAILTMFTFGCVLGGINLAVVAAEWPTRLAGHARHHVGPCARPDPPGWVTFFVMGFTVSIDSPFQVHATLWRAPLLACKSLFAMAAALIVRTLADVWIGNPACISPAKPAGNWPS